MYIEDSESKHDEILFQYQENSPTIDFKANLQYVFYNHWFMEIWTSKYWLYQLILNLFIFLLDLRKWFNRTVVQI